MLSSHRFSLTPRLVLVLAAALSVICSTAAVRADPLEIRVDANRRHQTVQGFGASIMAWRTSMYRFYYDEAFVDYAANTLGQSIFRLQMWGGVLPKEVPDWRDISYRNFDWTTDGIRGKVNTDFARDLHAANPEVRIVGSVWSAPAWMKENNSRTGTRSGYLLNPDRTYDDDNRLREDRYQHFAKYVVEWARLMEAQGTSFYAISLQNELVFTQWFESTIYTAEEYARVVKVTGEMFESEGVRKPLFFGPEDMSRVNYDDEVRHRPYVDALMAPEVARFFDVFATHGYSDGVRGDGSEPPVAYARSIAQFNRPYWITEGGSGPHTWPAALRSGVGIALHVALARANVSLFCGWQLASEPGKASEHDFMDGATPTEKTYTAMHYWRHIRPGAVRVETAESPAEDIYVTAFVHDERGEAVNVLINTADTPREVKVDWAGVAAGAWQTYQTTAGQNHEPVTDFSVDGQGRATLTLPGPSITTLVAPLRTAAAGQR